MDITTSFGLIDLIVAGAGFYGFYSWYLLTKKHEIKKTFLIGGSTAPEQCSDIDGFAAFIGKKLLIFSAAMVIYGGLSAYHSYVGDIGVLLWISMALFLAVIIWYCIQLRKADQLFFQAQGKNGKSVKDRALNK